MSVPGSTIAGSLPPNSRVTGVRCVVAARATWERIVHQPTDCFSAWTNLPTNELGTYEYNVLNFGRYCQGLCLISRATYKLRLSKSGVITSAWNSLQNTKHTCTNSGSKLQARRHSLMTSTNHFDDHATCSEHLTTTALPEKRAASTGDQALCKAEKR